MSIPTGILDKKESLSNRCHEGVDVSRSIVSISQCQVPAALSEGKEPGLIGFQDFGSQNRCGTFLGLETLLRRGMVIWSYQPAG